MTGSVTQSPAAYLSPWPIDENNPIDIHQKTHLLLRTVYFVVLLCRALVHLGFSKIFAALR
jgi:hypothetical protein